MNQQEIEKGLFDLGLKKGDIVLLHSALSSLGKVEGGTDTLINSFLNVLGNEGTLVVPSFAGGAVPLAVKNHEKAFSSIAPNAYISAIGKDAEELCKDHYKNETAHAEGTPYEKIAEKGGYILLLGVDQDRNTTLHSVEEFLRLPYMKDTKPVEIDTPEGKIEKSWKYFPGPHRDFIGLDRYFRNSGKMKISKIGNAVARLIKSHDLLDIGSAIGKEDPSFVLCENPNCKDCVTQNSEIIRAELKKESFTLAVSSSLAGRYIPEMIENCQKTGIDNIELDYIQGKAAADIQKGILAGYVHELDTANIKISGVRFNAITDDIAEKFSKVKEQGIKRVILPLVESAGELIEKADQTGLEVSFYNKSHNSKTTSSIVLAVAEKSAVKVTFNAANFALAGENPFLTSYKAKLRRYIDQLDIADITFDGTPQPLACGNAEIKEMISILRCASFAGYFVLTDLNRQSGNLIDVANDFFDLLENM